MALNPLMFTSMTEAVKVLEEDPKGREAVRIVTDMKKEAQQQSQIPDSSHPIIVIDGNDGTGKTTLVANLRKHYDESPPGELKSTLLKSPPDELKHLRPHFDDPKQHKMRRAFYVLGNYACALRMQSCAAKGPVVIDRFWPSTVAYALAMDYSMMPDAMPEILVMPRDLVELLPSYNPIIFMLLELSEKDRASRVRSRAQPVETMSAGFGLAASVPVTAEEEELERSQPHRDRLNAAYRALSINDEPLLVCTAEGTPQEVLKRALGLIEKSIPTSVNWHYTRECNYKCKFCFHTATTSDFLPKSKEGMEESKGCLAKLRQAGMKKINFSGGEPFLHPKELGELCRYCKNELRLESVSIISNGSKIQKAWIAKFGAFVDILAISCDSFNEETNKHIGRGTGMHLTKLEQVKSWCDEYKVPFKVNSVINIHNVDEDMTQAIERLQPVRWKVFQCLLLGGENAGEGALRDARDLVISQDHFDAFLQRHASVKCLVPEDNAKMKDSYLILDEHLCFLNCTEGGKKPTESIRNVSVRKALSQAGFDAKMFINRGGMYEWNRAVLQPLQDHDIENMPTGCASPASVRFASKRAGLTQMSSSKLNGREAKSKHSDDDCSFLGDWKDQVKPAVTWMVLTMVIALAVQVLSKPKCK